MSNLFFIIHLMKRYKHLFFDLDRTLWDFAGNSKQTLQEIFLIHKLDKYFTDFNQFYELYIPINENLWEEYRNGTLKKDVLRSKRFYLTLLKVEYNNQKIAHKLGNDYIKISPTKTALFPYTYEVLDYLAPKYNLHIITNGFNEVQYTKLRNSSLDKYFKRVITSENAGYQKPHPGIFHFAISSVNAKKVESIMIGDDIKTDIIGAKNYGISQIHFNPNNDIIDFEPTYSIKSLKELISIF